ncbi:MAG TPA: CPBP family intramembrane glutamic endopeptidase [Acidimicrobiales bacterium]|nr:CPBP family intramembrane glutamic endopeptidase [Acidimicrobiales bacterium]
MSRRPPERGNAFGLAEALTGLAGGFLLSILATSVYLQASGHPKDTTSLGVLATAFVSLWVGFAGSVLLTAFGRRPPQAGPDDEAQGPRPRPAPSRSLVEDFGLRFKPIDVPIGIVVGVAAQYGLVPLLELPLYPFVHNLFQQLGNPAKELTSGVSGWQLAVLGALVCVGAPLFEELFFRGLLLRALLGRFSGLGKALGPGVAIGITAVVFGLVHFEALQFLGLAGFGAVLCLLAWRTGRLGPGIVAHSAFNFVTILTLALHK